mgnify:CR=1 FL=1
MGAYATNIWPLQKHFIASRPQCFRPSRPHRRVTERKIVHQAKLLPLLRQLQRVNCEGTVGGRVTDVRPQIAPGFLQHQLVDAHRIGFGESHRIG